MRSKDTGNGRRILAKVEVPLSVEDIATYALRYLDEIDDDDPKDTLINANKREIFNMAKNGYNGSKNTNSDWMGYMKKEKA